MNSIETKDKELEIEGSASFNEAERKRRKFEEVERRYREDKKRPTICDEDCNYCGTCRDEPDWMHEDEETYQMWEWVNDEDFFNLMF